MSFSSLMSSITPAATAGDWQVTVGEEWAQGRTLFGGLQAALAFEALQTEVPPEFPLRVLQVTFAAPVPPGAARIQSRILRRGGSAIHGEARLLGPDDATLCLVVAVFGKARTSGFQLQPEMPPCAAPEASNRFPYLEGITPVFTRQFRMAWAEGAFPFMGGHAPTTRIWIAHKDPAPPTLSHLIATADVVPSPALSTMKQVAMASSMTWTLEILDHDLDFAADAWWRQDTDVTAGGNGYLHQTGTVYNPAGRAAAYSRQSVVVFG